MEFAFHLPYRYTKGDNEIRWKVCLVFVSLCQICYGRYPGYKILQQLFIAPDFPEYFNMDMGLGVVGGDYVDIQMLPWLAQIILVDELQCGGVIISDRVIISAAHCFILDEKFIPPKYFQVKLGSSEILKGTVYKPCKIRLHPKYLREILDYVYDIALMLLTTNIEFNYRIQKATIAPNDQWKKDRTLLIVAGYGLVDNFGTGSEHLRMTEMRFVNPDTCNKTLDGSVMPVPEHMFCMVSDKFASDCHGDSGSGVMWENYVVGIVNVGRELECGSNTVPSMYADLTYFRNWIQTNVALLETRSYGKCEKNLIVEPS